jgi:hypothetical protein
LIRITLGHVTLDDAARLAGLEGDDIYRAMEAGTLRAGLGGEGGVLVDLTSLRGWLAGSGAMVWPLDIAVRVHGAGRRESA